MSNVVTTEQLQKVLSSIQSLEHEIAKLNKELGKVKNNSLPADDLEGSSVNLGVSESTIEQRIQRQNVELIYAAKEIQEIKLVVPGKSFFSILRGILILQGIAFLLFGCYAAIGSLIPIFTQETGRGEKLLLWVSVLVGFIFMVLGISCFRGGSCGSLESEKGE